MHQGTARIRSEHFLYRLSQHHLFLKVFLKGDEDCWITGPLESCHVRSSWRSLKSFSASPSEWHLTEEEHRNILLKRFSIFFHHNEQATRAGLFVSFLKTAFVHKCAKPARRLHSEKQDLLVPRFDHTTIRVNPERYATPRRRQARVLYTGQPSSTRPSHTRKPTLARNFLNVPVFSDIENQRKSYSEARNPYTR